MNLKKKSKTDAKSCNKFPTGIVEVKKTMTFSKNPVKVTPGDCCGWS